MRGSGSRGSDGGVLQILPEAHDGFVLGAVGVDGGLGQRRFDLQSLLAAGLLEGHPAGAIPATEDAALAGMALLVGYGFRRDAVDGRGQLAVQILATVECTEHGGVVSQPGEHHDLDLAEVGARQH
ncbi:MAG: hypothetical protein MZV64_10255 [Ignavibacteriales bacterium]|nr:hypothetical protein [Ignavibacteriales bacterium]